MTFALLALAPVLIVATYMVLGGLDGVANPQLLRAVLLIDIVYVIVVAALIAAQISRMISTRQRRSSGSRLHMRLTQVFLLIALVPTVVIAIFAMISLNFGLEGWFSDRVRNVVGNSLAAAEAYEAEHVANLRTDARVLARFLNRQKIESPSIAPGQFRQMLEAGQKQIQRGLTEAYVIDGSREIQARGERSYLFGYDAPDAEQIARARRGEIVVIKDWDRDEFRALAVLPAFNDRFLYVSRDVDGEILNLLDQTKETIALYQQLESDRGRLLFEFGLFYLGIALIVILASVWGALRFAERLSQPVGRLAGAAARVGAGDFDVQVREERGDDEIAMLGRAFNRMTRQVKAQRDALVDVNVETERRRRLFDSVLSGVTAGVIGLNAKGQIEVVNAAAEDLLGITADGAIGYSLEQVTPEFATLFQEFGRSGSADNTIEIDLQRKGQAERLLVRIASRQADGEVEGYVVTFDDITALVSAQRMAAWGDVARRIAHEIKNPLTPIQLSAERLRRKFGPRLGEDQAALEQYSDVIIRQTEDLRRIVDEFSKFARMPAAEMRATNVVPIIRDAIHLAESANPEVAYRFDPGQTDVVMHIDATMMTQVMNNLLKNAVEAIESHKATAISQEYDAEIRVTVQIEKESVVISVQDNGIGLPEKRANLFEPYVTHREKGTGLGLSIVKKIVEEHSGQLELLDADPFGGDGHVGAEIRMTFHEAVTKPVARGGAQDAVKSAAE